MSAFPRAEFWRGKKVLLTGHTGFKGAWLAFVLQKLGATVVGMALPAATHPNLYLSLGLQNTLTEYLGDIRDLSWVKNVVQQEQPEVVLHLAAQALVRVAYDDPIGTYTSNFLGTAHVLDALRDCPSVRVAVMVTTDKVYKNSERATPYKEDDYLGGHDPYSASKAACEILIESYRLSFLEARGICVMSARAGNVIGGGDWSPDRLVPDLVRAWNADQTVAIRRPDALRPWQHVLEPICAYLCLAEAGWQRPHEVARAWNLGPNEAATVRRVIELAQSCFGKGEVEFATCIAGVHEAGLLALDASLARRELGISPRWDLETAVEKTMHWYRQFESGSDASLLCLDDWESYCSVSEQNE